MASQMLSLVALGVVLASCGDHRQSAYLPDLAEAGLVPCKESSLQDRDLVEYQSALVAFGQAVENDGYEGAGTRFPSNVVLDSDIADALSVLRQNLSRQGFAPVKAPWLDNYPGWRGIYMAKGDDMYVFAIKTEAVSDQQYVSVSVSTLYPPAGVPLVPHRVSDRCPG